MSFLPRHNEVVLTYGSIVFLFVLIFVLSALAARCLEVVTIHIPVFKAHFEERLPPKQYVLLSQFDQILKVSRRHVV